MLFFDPITFGVPPKTNGGGALHYNNPIRVFLDESKRIWNYETERKAGIIVRVSTGRPKLRGFGDGLYRIVYSVEAIITDTQETEEMFANEIADLPLSERPHYCRFNVDQELEDIGFAEWKESALGDSLGATKEKALLWPEQVMKSCGSYRATSPESIVMPPLSPAT